MKANVFIIGAGAVGRSMAASLFGAGVRVSGLYDKYNSKVFEVASTLGVGAYFSDELPEVVASADVILVAVPEPEVAALCLSAVDSGYLQGHQVWMQMAGSLSAASLSTLSDHVAGVGTLHPALVFPPQETTMIPPDASFTFDGDDAARAKAQALTKALDCRIVELDASARRLYHAALVIGSNYQAALLMGAKKILQSAGMAGEDSEFLLVELAKSAVGNLASCGLLDGVSGPIRRGDAETVKQHLAQLGEFEELEQLYLQLGRLLYENLSREKIIGEQSSRSLREALNVGGSLSGAGESKDD